jgi:membrane protease subunit HflK
VSVRQIYITFFGAILAGLLILVAATTWYTVDQSEQAAVLTFGEVTEKVTEPGLHFKLPWPIQQVKVLSKETFSLNFGYDMQNGKAVTKMDEAKMLTGDENITLVTLVVQWRIGDVEKYLYNTADPEEVLFNATSAALRGVIGSSTIDDALTDGKIDIEARIEDLIKKLIMDKYDAGITIHSCY